MPVANYKMISASDVAGLKKEILSSALTTSELVKAAWASAVTFRGTDLRGGANGARIHLAPQKNWAVNDPQELAKVISKLESKNPPPSRACTKARIVKPVPSMDRHRRRSDLRPRTPSCAPLLKSMQPTTTKSALSKAPWMISVLVGAIRIDSCDAATATWDKTQPATAATVPAP